MTHLNKRKSVEALDEAKKKMRKESPTKISAMSVIQSNKENDVSICNLILL